MIQTMFAFYPRFQFIFVKCSFFSRIEMYFLVHASPLCKTATIHQVTTSTNVLFPGHNHLLTTIVDDPDTLIITRAHGGTSGG